MGARRIHFGEQGNMPHRFKELLLRPEQIQTMHQAYEMACASLRLSGHRIDQIPDDVALTIIELAKAGEADAERLCQHVLAHFAGADAEMKEQGR